MLWKHYLVPKACLKPQPLLTSDSAHISFLPHKEKRQVLLVKCLVKFPICVNLANSNKSLLTQKKEYPSDYSHRLLL